MPVYLAAIAIAIIALFLLSYRLYLVDRRKTAGDETLKDKNATEDGSGEEEPEEMVNLVDYFNDTPVEEAASQAAASSSGVGAAEAEYDKLCEVKVGQSYLDECQKALNEASEKGEVWAVLSLDIDRFRFVNSLRGISLGDYTITNMARELSVALPDSAHITRKSADHFFAAFRLNDISDMEGYCDRLRRGLERIRNDVGVKGGLRLSMGAALTANEGYDLDMLLAKANIARHCVKSSKNENYSVFDSTMLTSFLYGESALDDYADNQYGDEIALFFQPQSDVVRGVITASQVLDRWVCENSTTKDIYVSPENGKIPTNFGRVLYHSCREVNRWRKSGKESLPIFVYLPTVDFYKSDIDALFAKCLSEFQLETSFVIPVVEASAIRIQPQMAAIQLKKLSDIGLKIAVDTITATVPNFSHLSNMFLTYIKIPRGLTANIERKPEREQFLRNIHANALAAKLIPIYEGIDDTTRMNVIREIGGTLVEGRYAGRSALPDDFSKILQEYVLKRKNYDATVILEGDEFARGDYKL